MKLRLFMTASLLIVPAYAGDNNCNGNNSCPTNTTTTNNTTNAPTANANSTNVNVPTAYGGEGGHGGKGGNASLRSSIDVDQDQSAIVNYSNVVRPPVSTAAAIALATSPEACMGSSSIGGQGVGFGISIGSTWENEDCKLRKGAGLLWAMGARSAAKEMLCADEAYRNAFKSGGEPCSADVPVAVPVTELPVDIEPVSMSPIPN